MNAKDLLYKILDYECHWSHSYNNHSPSAVKRLEQINQLLEVFGLTTQAVDPLIENEQTFMDYGEQKRSEYLSGISNLKYVQSGEFVYDRLDGTYDEIIQKALPVVKTLFPNPDEVNESFLVPRGGDIPWMFVRLLEFRMQIHMIIQPKVVLQSGYSLGIWYAEHMKKQLNKTIKDNLTEIDDILWFILDPAKREFTNEEINFTEVDFNDMDIKWSAMGE